MFRIFYKNLNMSQRSADILTWTLIAITVVMFVVSVCVS